MDISPEAKKRLLLLIGERDQPLSSLAAKIGVSQSTLWNFIKGDTRSFSKIHRLATELKVSLDWILNGDLPPPSKGTERVFLKASENLSGQGFKSLDAAIPVLGRPVGAADGVLIDAREKIGDTERHPAQKNMRDAFALYVIGETMLPRYRPGELVYVATQKQPAKGQDCVIELTNGEGYLREFVTQKGEQLVCRSLNPDKQQKWRLREVKEIHAVVGRG